MYRLIVNLLIATLLTGALAWSADGHVFGAAAPDTGAALVQHFHNAPDQPSNPSPQTPCDHHCHADAHMLGLFVLVHKEAILDRAPERSAYSADFLSYLKTPPSPPPTA